MNNYNKEHILLILENELFNKEYNINYKKPQPANCKICNNLRIYFKNKYPNLFSGRAEILYCYKYKDHKIELLNKMFCKCGNRNTFLNYNDGYSKHCCYKCSNSDPDKILKIEKINIEKYGVKHNWSSKDPKLNGRKTRKERYGVESCLSSKDPKLNGKLTMLKKYGFKYYAQTEDSKKLWNNKDWVNKRESNRLKTLQNKYNGRSPIVDLNIQKNRFNTMRKNKTFNSSKVEIEVNIKLKSIYSDVKYIYKDDARYPFNCDFYIPSKDLFIELNFHWTHGKEPFDKNNPRHIEILNKWKEKSIKSNFYKTAINIWTIRDPLKLKTFQENCLNYKIFYNKKDLDEWLRNL